MGSISGSAFLHGIFYFIDLLIDLFTVFVYIFSLKIQENKSLIEILRTIRQSQHTMR